jgi:hypothetical protein
VRAQAARKGFKVFAKFAVGMGMKLRYLAVTFGLAIFCGWWLNRKISSHGQIREAGKPHYRAIAGIPEER